MAALPSNNHHDPSKFEIVNEPSASNESEQLSVNDWITRPPNRIYKQPMPCLKRKEFGEEQLTASEQDVVDRAAEHGAGFGQRQLLGEIILSKSNFIISRTGGFRSKAKMMQDGGFLAITVSGANEPPTDYGVPPEYAAYGNVNNDIAVDHAQNDGKVGSIKNKIQKPGNDVADTIEVSDTNPSNDIENQLESATPKMNLEAFVGVLKVWVEEAGEKFAVLALPIMTGTLTNIYEIRVSNFSATRMGKGLMVTNAASSMSIATGVLLRQWQGARTLANVFMIAGIFVAAGAHLLTSASCF